MKKHYLTCALTGLLLFNLAPHHLYAASKTEDRVHLLGVAGDAILIESNGRFALMDGGEDSDNPRGFANLETTYKHEEDVIRYLKKVAGDKNGKVTLDFIIGTHAHSDHLGGLDTVVNHPDITVKTIYLKKYNEAMISDWEVQSWDNKEVYEQLLTAAKKNNVPVEHNLPTESFKFGDFSLQLYNTELHDIQNGKVGENENSLALKVTKGKTALFLAGDLNNLDGDEDRLAKQIGKVDLLKLGHHGGTHSSTSNFLKTLQPNVAFSNKGGAPDVRNSLLELGTAHYAVELNDGIVIDFEDCSTTNSNLTYSIYKADTAAYQNKRIEPTLYNQAWTNEKGYWQYLKPNGQVAVGWQYLEWAEDYNWYYFDRTGRMLTGWQYLNWNGENAWYYFGNSGEMLRGLNYLKWNGVSSWYYLGNSGALQLGWIKDGNHWLYADKSGKILTGWQYLNWNGKNAWYYFNSRGIMQTGWLTEKGKTYYLNKDGSMVTGTKWIDGKSYRFHSNGHLL